MVMARTSRIRTEIRVKIKIKSMMTSMCRKKRSKMATTLRVGMTLANGNWVDSMPTADRYF